MNNKIKLSIVAGAIAVIGATAGLTANADAAQQTANTVINGIISQTISVATSAGTVNMNVTPTGAGAITTGTHNVIVNTNSSTGYNLTLSTSSAANALTKGADSIAASAGTQTTPVALAANTWGYRVDSVAGFGTGSSVISNQASSTMKFAGVPASGSAQNIATSATTANNATTPVYYGINATNAKPSGTYTNTVVYTAVTK